MTPERWRKIEEVFHQALECEYSKRALFLEEACAGDLALRREVESLLASAEEAKAGSFLNAPALVANNRPLLILKTEKKGRTDIVELLKAAGATQ